MADKEQEKNLAAMKDKLDQARDEEQIIHDDGGDPLDDLGITPEFIKNCFYNNERGDGILFASLMRDLFLHMKNTSQWLAWTGHHWQIDKADLVHDAVEQVAGKYLEQADYHKDQEKVCREAEKFDKEKYHKTSRSMYMKRINRLRGLRGAKNCIEWSHKIGDQSLAIIGDELDQKPWLLPCSNGVIDLKTGKLVDGRPADYLVKAIPVEFTDIQEECPEWEKFINTIHQEDPEIVAFIQRLLGYSITGLVTEHFIACFVGEGRNGKGTMFETLKTIMGDLAWSIQPELILEQKNIRSSAGPSADLISLQGRRLVVAAETDEHRRISGSKVKSLTGGDTICARSPHDRFETNFRPTHTLFLHTNHAPSGLTRDFALFKRLLFINYPLKFIDDPKEINERPRDPDLPAKLAKEASGILGWLVAGCLEWQRLGLAPPKKIRADAEKLRISEDVFQQFFNEHLISDDPAANKLLHKDLYGKFEDWFIEEIDESKRYIPSKKAITAWLDKRGFERDRKGGQATIYGIRFKAEQDDLNNPGQK